MNNNKHRVAIVGAGLTGLTAAWKLRGSGVDVKVFEASNLVGGRTRSVRKDGFVFDVGAITMLPTYDNTCALIDELGIRDNLHRIAPVIGIPRNGVIHNLDLNTPIKSILSTKLIKTTDKLVMLKLIPSLVRAWSCARYSSLAPLRQWDGESIANWVERELNHEIHNYIVGPIIRGNTLNSTEDAPFGELLWMLKGYSAPFVQNFDQGINFLAESLAKTASIRFLSQVHALAEMESSVNVKGVSEGVEFSEEFDACILALSPLEMNEIDAPIPVMQRKFLREIKPLPSVNFHFGLKKRPGLEQTFILPPESESEMLTTIVLDHNKAPGRAPEGKSVVTMFCRDTWSARNFERSDDELISEVLEMAKPFVGDISDEIETVVVQRWPYAIIKSEVGIYQKIAAFEAAADQCSRVQLAGDFLSMGMEAAVCSGMQAAKRTTSMLHC